MANNTKFVDQNALDYYTSKLAEVVHEGVSDYKDLKNKPYLNGQEIKSGTNTSNSLEITWSGTKEQYTALETAGKLNENTIYFVDGYDVPGGDGGNVRYNPENDYIEVKVSNTWIPVYFCNIQEDKLFLFLDGKYYNQDKVELFLSDSTRDEAGTICIKNKANEGIYTHNRLIDDYTILNFKIKNNSGGTANYQYGLCSETASLPAIIRDGTEGGRCNKEGTGWTNAELLPGENKTITFDMSKVSSLSGANNYAGFYIGSMDNSIYKITEIWLS